MAKVMERIEQIKNNQNFTEEQKMQMIGRLMMDNQEQSGGYVRETEKEPEPVVVDQAEQKDSWVPDYHRPFKPTFASTGADDVFTIKDGALSVRVRKLKMGDYMKLAALIPKWKNHLLGDAPFEAFINESGGIEIFQIIGLLIVKAMEDWDFKNGCPSGFSLSVLSIIRDFLANPGDVTINDLLDSDPEELIELAIGIYGNNLRFFTKITTRFGILQDLKAIYSGMSGTLRNALRAGAESLSSKESKTDLPKVEENQSQSQTEDLSGGQSGGGTKRSSSRSAKARKGS